MMKPGKIGQHPGWAPDELMLLTIAGGTMLAGIGVLLFG
jgi:hypothetical protein